MAAMTIEAAMQLALAHHQAGRLTEAEELYRRVLAQSPAHPGALHLLGVVACQTGHTDAAIDLIGRAIAAEPASAEYHNNLGESYRRAGRWEEAIARFRRAAGLKPEMATAHVNLGDALSETGRRDEALAAYEQAARLAPGDAALHNRLGNTLRALGRPAEAIAAYRRALELRADLAEVHSNLGLALHEAGRSEEAVAALDRAVALRPDLAVAHCNRGNALGAVGRPAEAIEAYRRSLAIRPDDAATWSNLGVVLHAAGRSVEAIAAYEEALKRKPDDAVTYANLGATLQETGRAAEAITWCARALALKPDSAEAYNNLGNALSDLDRLDEAIAAYERARQLGPADCAPCSNLAKVLRDQGRLDEALALLRKAVALKPAEPTAASGLVTILHYHPDYDAAMILAEHRRWAEQYADSLAAGARARPHANDRTPGRRLRVGYVSPDFREHPVGRSLLSLFSHHDRQQVEVLCYSDVRAGDPVTARLETLADRWRSTVGLRDERLAELIRTDEVDILVDLALHTAHNRLLVFARKPAPVQVTMLGMPATTGLTTMDYRITDPYLDPPGTSGRDYTEQSIRLPHCYWCYHPPEGAPPPGALPALANGFVTFGCLNQFSKVSRPALRLWAEVLRSVPGARLLLLAQPGSHRDAVRAEFRASGVAADRVEFVERAGRQAYFARYTQIDLSLDPFPYNGHTSSIDSLWMGVPVVTLAGRTAVGRGGVSILSNAGLCQFIARTPEEYVAIAGAWARDLPRLAALRAGLREQTAASPLVDGRLYARDVERAYRSMWTMWCE